MVKQTAALMHVKGVVEIVVPPCCMRACVLLKLHDIIPSMHACMHAWDSHVNCHRVICFAITGPVSLCVLCYK